MSSTPTHPTQHPLRQRAAELARYIGPDWTVATRQPNDRPHTVLLSGPDGMGIYLEARTWPPSAAGRVVVSGIYPVDDKGTPFGGWDRDPVITVAGTRPARAIGQKIRTRLLPAYREQYARAAAHARQAQECARLERALMDRLAPIIAAERTTHLPCEASRVLPNGQGCVTLTTYAGSVTLTMERVPSDLAAQLLEVLADHCAAHPSGML